MKAPAFRYVPTPTVGSRATSALSCLIACLATAPLTACGDDPKASPLDPETFSGMHQMELADDCDKTVQCKAQRGETLRKDDPVGHCILDTANVLNDDKKLQDSFLSNYARCHAFAVCDYVTCAESGGQTYGDMQRGDVQHACQAEIECNLVRGAMGNSDPVVCEETKVNELNRYVPTQRSRWEASFDACKGEVGCNYVDCYQAAFFGATGGM